MTQSNEKFASYTQEERNQEILRESSLGVLLEQAYVDAIQVDPRLSEIAVVPITDIAEHRHAYAKPRWHASNQSGNHEIHIRLEDLDGTLAFFAETMKKVPKNTEIIAATLGIKPSEVTPQLMYVQSMLHEMGHTLEYDDYERAGKTPEDHNHDRKVERATLPIGNLLVSHMLDENNPKRNIVEDQWEKASASASNRYSAYKGEDVTINTMDELIDATTDVYRHSKFEHAADSFASKVLQEDPLLVMQLTGDTVEPYRDHPRFGDLQMAA